METGKLIKELRTKKGMTQEELAEKTEVSTRTIQRIENGEVDPRAYTLQMIAKALEVAYSLFVNDEPDQENEAIKAADDSNWLGLLHLSCLVPLIFPAVMIWNAKKNTIKGIAEQYRTVISFQLMILGVILGCLWVYWKVHIIMPLIGVLLANALFSIFRAIHVVSTKAVVDK